MAPPLKIEKLTEKNTEYAENKKIPEPLPKLPARVLWVASSGSGKTLCLGNMLARKEFGYKNIFKDNVFLFRICWILRVMSQKKFRFIKHSLINLVFLG